MKPFDKKLLIALGEKILKRKQTIAVAESVTSGLLQFALSCIPEAARFFQGGITAYNIAQKFKHLRVEPLHALSVNCVSSKVAREMALHVCEAYSSDWGIAVTGYASPVPESENKVFAFFAIACKGKIKLSGRIKPRKLAPPEMQWTYTNHILGKLLTLL
jgi:nicotinamide-nucleotide amidase